ncbi:hypothetical protein COOONC_16253 [Cooperia oncophora]
MMDVSGGTGAATGLRAEPTLKHFDENIISLIESEIMSVTHETGWSDVAGLEGAKKALREIVVLPFKKTRYVQRDTSSTKRGIALWSSWYGKNDDWKMCSFAV